MGTPIRTATATTPIPTGAAWTDRPGDPTLWLGPDATCTLDHLTLEASPERLWDGVDPASLDVIDVITRIEPGFVDVSGTDPSTWDLHLQSDSPLVDAGSLDRLDPDGSRSDVGAYGGPGGGW